MAKVFSSIVQAIMTLPNKNVFRTEVITVTSAGTPVQLPSIYIPDGFDLVIRAKQTNGQKKIYLSNSQSNVADPTKRIELLAGDSIGLGVTNSNLVWIDANENEAQVELIIEA
ncbi:MAG: hypothetical protein K6T73_01210 [Candidatus Bathyarchaeota archaeon]|nr:hypothetical protein [Candidatus Bathyarchaeota archaeon]